MSLSTTAINDRHASHRNGFTSTAGIHQKRSVAFRFAWTMDYHIWGAMLEAYYTLHPKPKSITQLKNGTVCHRNRSTRLLKASHYNWRDAQKLTVNNLSTYSDCQTWDFIVKYLYLEIKHCVVSVTLFCCVSAQTFFSARKSLRGHAKIPITSSYFHVTWQLSVDR